MKKPEWETPNKMKIETGHKTFDKQTNLISYGNIFANTMMGFSIRPYTETMNGGLEFPSGYLRDADLAHFHNLPRDVKDYVIKHTMTEGVYLYSFYHFNGDKKIFHGCVVTTLDHKLKRILYDKSRGVGKSEGIIRECLKYVTND